MSLSEAATVVQGRCLGADAHFYGCGIDSRTISQDAMFVAMRGENVDGHDFLQAAARAGAAAAMVEKEPGDTLLPCMLVPASSTALAQLAAHWRGNFELPLIAVTGSNGKTTVKTMLDTVLRSCAMRVLATEGNLNNELGVPLTLLKLDKQHECAVIEMGAAAVGDISYLASIARPTVAVVTLCAPAHLQGFGSIEAVARTKGEVFSALPPGGVAVINNDDEYSELWQSMAAHCDSLSFGVDSDAEVRAEDIIPDREGSSFKLVTPGGAAELRLLLPGQHNIVNAVAAAAAAYAIGVDTAAIAAGLAMMRPLPGRLSPVPGIHGSVILDDSYNANPGSLLAGLKVLQQYDAPRWLILGEMAELGAEACEWHQRAGMQAKEHGVEKLVTVGELAGLARKDFGDAAISYPGDEAMLAMLQAAGAAVILVKGSRCAGMERIVNKLTGVR